MASAAHVAHVAVVGAGPAGLAAAEVLGHAGVAVDVFDAMPSVGRKFLRAGIGGLNLTHSDAFDDFVARYGAQEPQMRSLLAPFDADAIRAWAYGLGIETFVGSSGRVFPKEMKAAPLLRAWLARLRASDVRFHMRHRWRALTAPTALTFDTPLGELTQSFDAVVFALGGASWPQLGSDGSWVTVLRHHGISVNPLRPANCGFDTAWSAFFIMHFAGAVFKSVSLAVERNGHWTATRGEFVASANGIEGGLVYTLSAVLRDAIEFKGDVTVRVDLLPDWSQARVDDELIRGRATRSMASHLQSRAGITGVKAALLREVLGESGYRDVRQIAAIVKRVPLCLTAARPMAEAISSAGGVRFDALDATLMTQALPGVFCAGEMLDWEAPTGGYLLTGCLASGRAAATGVLKWIDRQALGALPTDSRSGQQSAASR